MQPKSIWRAFETCPAGPDEMDQFRIVHVHGRSDQGNRNGVHESARNGETNGRRRNRTDRIQSARLSKRSRRTGQTVGSGVRFRTVHSTGPMRTGNRNHPRCSSDFRNAAMICTRITGAKLSPVSIVALAAVFTLFPTEITICPGRNDQRVSGCYNFLLSTKRMIE